MTTTMKKIFAILCAASALLISCTKVAPEAQESETGNAAGKIQVNIAVSREGDTKAVKTGWEKGDVIYVFFNQLAASATPKYLTLTFDGNGWDNTWYGDADADLLTMSTGTMTAVYFPFHSGQVNISSAGTAYSLRSKISGENGIHSYYMKAENTSFTVSNATVTGTLNMTLPYDDYVHFFLPDESASLDGKYYLQLTTGTLSWDNRVQPVGFYGSFADKIGPDGTVKTEYEDILGPWAEGRIKGYVYQNGDSKGYVFSFRVPAGNKFKNAYITDTQNFLTYALLGSNEIDPTAKAAIRLPSLDSWIECVEVNMNAGGRNLMFATKNLGATSQEDAGSFYSWGETTPKLQYIHEDFYEKWWDGASYSKYTTSDSKVVLDAEDDAATVALGEPWRTPTHEEIVNLVTGATSTTINGQKGLLCTYQSYVDQQLFLPFAGKDNGTVKGYNELGAYWTSSIGITSELTDAYVLKIGDWTSNGGGDLGTSPVTAQTLSRYQGLSIRPVFTKK